MIRYKFVQNIVYFQIFSGKITELSMNFQVNYTGTLHYHPTFDVFSIKF